MTTPRIAVLMTCHNRRALTVRCLESLRAQQLFREEDLFLVNDGSSDGTGDAVRSIMPGATVIRGSGDLFWNGGMRLAWDRARVAGVAFDHYFWLNDDVVLHSDAFATMTADAQAVAGPGAPVIVVGSMAEPGGCAITYGGQTATSSRRPLRFELVKPTGTPQRVDTLSGNAVLVSAAAEARLGNISSAFEHIFGDLDYGLRARAAGVPVFAASAIIGECAGPDPSPVNDPRLGRWHRLLLRLKAERRIHARDWRVFARLHSGLGPLSLLYSVAPYVRALLDRPVRTDTSAHPMTAGPGNRP